MCEFLRGRGSSQFVDVTRSRDLRAEAFTRLPEGKQIMIVLVHLLAFGVGTVVRAHFCVCFTVNPASTGKGDAGDVAAGGATQMNHGLGDVADLDDGNCQQILRPSFGSTAVPVPSVSNIIC
jgi:hypothetical protein